MAENDFMLPKLNPQGGYEGIMSLLSSIDKLPGLRQTVQPEIQGLMGDGGPIAAPQLAAIRRQTGQNVAGTQSDLMARGLTGSDIELSALAGARGAGLDAEANFRGQIGSSLLDMLMRATQGDITAATNLRQMLAQAMGQELTAQRDMRMFGQQLGQASLQASRNRNAQLISAGIGAAGEVGGAGLASAVPFLLSDRRLKRDIEHIGESDGLAVYRWKWNKKAEEFGHREGRKFVGVMADEAREKFPDAVKEVGGFLMVNYDALPIGISKKMADAWGA